MREYEISPSHGDFFEYHSGIDNLRIQELNRTAPLLKLLIIDDEEHVLANLCSFLKYKNYDVTSASDGLEGLKLLKNNQQGFDLIITDIVMPQLSGISLISIIKKKFPDTPVIAITGWGEFPEAFAIESQADKVLSKPFELSELDKAINELISLKKCNVQLPEAKLAEETQRESEDKYRQLFNTVTDAIMLFDAEARHFIDVNDATLSLYGYSREDFLKLRHQDITAEPEKSDTSISQTLEGKLVRIPVRYHKKKDGTIFPVEISASTLMLKNRKVLCGVIRDITERMRAEGLVRNLSQMLMEAHERERRMISIELHDNIAQNLSWIKMDCDTFFSGNSDVSSELIEKMNKISKLVGQTITAIRDLSYDLRPPGLDEMGLVKAIEIYCREFSERSGLKVALQSAGIHKLDLDNDTKIHIYRLIQEGLNNVRKHADADRVVIKLVGKFPNILLRIEDNGKGFDIKARALSLGKEKRMGLRSMNERVNLLGGKMTIQSHLMKGTKLFIKFPFKKNNSKSEEKHIH